MQFSISTSLTLIQRVQKRNPEAWVRFARLYSPLVYGWARRLNLQPTDADDLVQEVFVAVSASVERYDAQRGDFRGWLWGVTRNKVAQHFRQASRRKDGEGGSAAHVRLEELPEEAPGVASEAATRIARRALDIIKVDFQPTTWTAFWRVTVEGQSSKDVAEDLGISLASVYAAKSRVLAHLRRELDGLLD